MSSPIPRFIKSRAASIHGSSPGFRARTPAKSLSPFASATST